MAKIELYYQYAYLLYMNILESTDGLRMKKLLIILTILIGSIVLITFTTHVACMELIEFIMQKIGVRCYMKRLVNIINGFLNSRLRGLIEQLN